MKSKEEGYANRTGYLLDEIGVFPKKEDYFDYWTKYKNLQKEQTLELLKNVNKEFNINNENTDLWKK